MIIDLILDRRDGDEYNPVDFFINVAGYGKFWPTIARPILEAMFSGRESDVKLALSYYIMDEGYNPEIIDYIKSVNWL